MMERKPMHISVLAKWSTAFIKFSFNIEGATKKMYNISNTML